MKKKFYVLVTNIVLLFFTFALAQPSYVPQNDLVAWWDFNNNSLDESPLNNHGSANGVEYVSNRFNSSEEAIRFTGLNSYVEVDHTNDFNLDNNSSYSISFWIKIEDNPNNVPEAGVIAKWNELLSSSYPVRIDATDMGNGESRLSWRIYSIQPASQYYLDVFLKNNCYYHVTYVVSDFVCKLYINAEFTNSVSFTPGNFDNNHNLFIGKRNTPAPRRFKGTLDELGIWNRALEENEILDLFKAGDTDAPYFCCDFEKDLVVESVNTCSDFLWIDGNTYSESTSEPRVYLSNKEGCDSILQLELTIYEPQETVDQQFSCGDFLWIDGNTYSESTNLPTVVLNDVNGCDSIVHLDLVIIDPDIVTDHQTACNSFTWIDGILYDESTTGVEVVLSNQYGCDSIVYLDLQIYNSYETNIDIDTCNFFTWIDGVTYNESTQTSYILTDIKGCDSIVNLSLTIEQPEIIYDYHCSFDSLLWINGEVYYESTNTPVVSAGSQLGHCDTLIQLNLDIYSTNVIKEDEYLSFEESGFNYQWFDCDTDTYIENATNQTFYPNKPGDYRVVVSKADRSCSYYSDCITFGTLSSEFFTLRNTSSLIVFPNPTSDAITIKVPEIGGDINILDPLGRIIYSINKIQDDEIDFSFEGMEMGVYFVTYSLQGNKFINRVVKE